MKCNEIRELLSLYIDQMLDEGQAKEMEEHLSACDACRNEYNELKGMINLLGQAEMIPVPDAFSFRLKKALNEEKQNRMASGITGEPSKKKKPWRIITSVAAVFAVGVLSFGVYHDVLGILPDKINGGNQTGSAQPEELFHAKSNDAAGDINISSDGSVVMKNQVNADSDPAAKTPDPAASDEMQNYSAALQDTAALKQESASNTDNAQTMTAFGQTDGAPSDTADEYEAAADAVTEPEAAAGAFGFDTMNPDKSKVTSSSEDCSRSITSFGVERNAAAVQFYDNLIEEKLKGFDYQVLDSIYTKTGEWQFRIFIFRGKDGNTYNEEILIMGKDGEIEVICSNEFMGL